MASQYSIIKYVPDPITEERINVGVIAFNEDAVRVRFLSNWDRVRCFGMEDIHFLINFAERMEDAASVGLLFPGDEPSNTPKQDRLARIAKGWINSIQFTAPRGSLDTLDGLLEYAAQTYLREPQPEPKSALRDRGEAASVTRIKTREALQKRFGKKAKDLLRSDYEVRGRDKQNKFDVAVANGRLYLAAHAISFEVSVREIVRESVLWRVSDVKKAQPNLPLAVVTLPPKLENPHYEHLQKVYLKTT